MPFIGIFNENVVIQYELTVHIVMITVISSFTNSQAPHISAKTCCSFHCSQRNPVGRNPLTAMLIIVLNTVVQFFCETQTQTDSFFPKCKIYVTQYVRIFIIIFIFFAWLLLIKALLFQWLSFFAQTCKEDAFFYLVILTFIRTIWNLV